jgi:hypothetical protein
MLKIDVGILIKKNKFNIIKLIFIFNFIRLIEKLES